MKTRKNKFVKIKKSRIKGKGLFSLKNFSKGDKIYSFGKGKILNVNEIKKISIKEKRYLDKISQNKYEIIEPPAKYINHSCEPNIKEKKRTGYALKNIKKGDEFTINYDKVAYLSKPFRCFCKTKNCRKFVYGK